MAKTKNFKIIILDFIPIIIGIAFLMCLFLGLRMAFHKAGRGKVVDWKQFNFFRTLLITALAFALAWHLFSPATIPDKIQVSLPAQLQWFGLVIFIIGFSLRAWCQKLLGPQWSSDISIGSHHRLIQNGAYAYVRHPMYASYLLITPGLFLCTGNALILLLSLFYTLFSLLRIPEEEALLHSKFGEEYDRYAGKTRGRIFPFTLRLRICSQNLFSATV